MIRKYLKYLNHILKKVNISFLILFAILSIIPIYLILDSQIITLPTSLTETVNDKFLTLTASMFKSNSVPSHYPSTLPSPYPTATPYPTTDPNPIVSCPISKECGGGFKDVRLKECQNSTCCGINGKEWKYMSSIEQCKKEQNDYANRTPSDRSIIAVTKLLTSIKFMDQQENKNKNFTEVVLNYARELDDKPVLLAQTEIQNKQYDDAIAMYNQRLQQQQNQPQQQQVYIPMPIYQPPLIIQNNPLPKLDLGGHSANCNSNGLGGFHCSLY